LRYLRLARARSALLLFLGSSLLFVALPALDLAVSKLFFDGRRFPLADRRGPELLQDCVGWFVVGAVALALGLWVVNAVTRRRLLGIDGRVVGYLLLVLILGAGVVVNLALKNGIGRARPRNVTEFGGRQAFTPAFVVSNACPRNGSFSSGDAAGAFFAFALVFALGRRRTLLWPAVAFGGLVSFARIASGAHFLSDVVVSFFVMWITADALHFYLLAPERAVVVPAAVAAEGVPALPAEGLAAVGAPGALGD
jgi:lipid A 4'-phosphatase